MYNNLELLAQVAFILLVIGLITMLWMGMRSIFQRMEVPAEKRQSLLHYILLGILFWLTFIGVLAHFGFFENFQTLPPRIGVAMFPPIFLVFILLRSKNFNKILAFTPMSWLVYAQSFRIAVELILWLGYKADFIPFQMTFEGWNYDIIVGITAISAGMVFFGKNRIRRFQAIIWNVFGLLLLMTIVWISVVSTPSPFRIFMNEPANIFMAYVPFIWLPGFVVPFAFAMHVFSLKQLLDLKKT